jgi:hypothetical protein
MPRTHTPPARLDIRKDLAREALVTYADWLVTASRDQAPVVIGKLTSNPAQARREPRLTQGVSRGSLLGAAPRPGAANGSSDQLPYRDGRGLIVFAGLGYCASSGAC